MKDIQQVLRRKRAQQAQLAKEIELLQQAEVTLREVAPLLADSDEDDSTLLSDIAEEPAQPSARAASAGADTQTASETPARGTVPRWP